MLLGSVGRPGARPRQRAGLLGSWVMRLDAPALLAPGGWERQA